MKTSTELGAIFEAFVKAQAELKNAVFDKQNPHFKSKYATLAGMRDGIVATLSKHGLAVIQGSDMTEYGPVINTRLVHSTGQWIESSYPIAMDKPQQMGSAYTYARRYSLAAICGIASEEDDDGNAVQETAKEPVPMVAANGTPGASKAFHRDTYDKLVKEIRNANGKGALEEIYRKNITDIDAMPPDFLDELRVEYNDRLSELKQKAAA